LLQPRKSQSATTAEHHNLLRPRTITNRYHHVEQAHAVRGQQPAGRRPAVTLFSFSLATSSAAQHTIPKRVAPNVRNYRPKLGKSISHPKADRICRWEQPFRLQPPLLPRSANSILKARPMQRPVNAKLLLVSQLSRPLRHNKANFSKSGGIKKLRAPRVIQMEQVTPKFIKPDRCSVLSKKSLTLPGVYPSVTTRIYIPRKIHLHPL